MNTTEQKTKHTLGPWQVKGGRWGYEIQTPEPNKQGALTIVASQSTAHRDGDENDANARLIAAAPEMLEALQAVADAYQRMFDVMPVAWQTFDDIVQQAIARATGSEA
jgi:hypothetical protein